MLVGIGQLAVVAEVVQVLIILLYRSGGREAWPSTVVFPDEGKRDGGDVTRPIQNTQKGRFSTKVNIL